MTAHRLAGILVAGFFFLHGGSASAQSCPPSNFTGTVVPGDGSEPIEDFHLGAGHCCGYFVQTQGPAGQLSLNISPAFPGWEIQAWSSPYFTEVRPGVDCVENPVTHCVTCSPAQMSIDLYALLGNYKGIAVSLPSGRCEGERVYAGPNSAPVQSDCSYNFAYLSPTHISNGWGLQVFREPNSTGKGEVTYALNYRSITKTATTHSSENKVVNFFEWNGEPVECQRQKPEVKTPPAACGNPAQRAS